VTGEKDRRWREKQHQRQPLRLLLGKFSTVIRLENFKGNDEIFPMRLVVSRQSVSRF
jgi:hypothetical protein